MTIHPATRALNGTVVAPRNFSTLSRNRVVPAVVPKHDFVEIGAHVLHGELMGRANDGALEQRPHTLSVVRRHVGADIFFLTVGGAPVIDAVKIDVFVRGVLVRMDRALGIGHVRNKLPQVLLLSGGDHLQPDRTAALDRSDDDSLVRDAFTVRAAGLSADVGLVHFDHIALEIAAQCQVNRPRSLGPRQLTRQPSRVAVARRVVNQAHAKEA